MCRYVSGSSKHLEKERTEHILLPNQLSGTNRFAPGTDITSITSDSDTATDTLTGTSMAAPREYFY